MQNQLSVSHFRRFGDKCLSCLEYWERLRSAKIFWLGYLNKIESIIQERHEQGDWLTLLQKLRYIKWQRRFCTWFPVIHLGPPPTPSPVCSHEPGAAKYPRQASVTFHSHDNLLYRGNFIAPEKVHRHLITTN